MQDFIQYAFAGITVGSIYALVAIGYSVIYNATRIVNFAQGEFVMLGGMATISLYNLGLPLWLAIICAVCITALTGSALERMAIRPARDGGVLMLIIVTIGASITFRGIAQVLWDRNYHSLPAFSGTEAISVLGATITPQNLWVIGVSMLVVAVLHQFLSKSLLGKQILATAADPDAAQLVGINIKNITLITFGLAGGLGAIAGALIAPITLMHFEAGVMLGLKGFAAAMLGGLGRFPGAILGGILLGLGESMTAGYLTSSYKDAVAFIAVVVILVVLPTGLLGERKVERV